MNIFILLRRYSKNPKKLIRTLGTNGWLNWLPDKAYLKLLYWGEMGKKLNLDNPKTYNEKLQWLKLYKRIPEYSTYVDKYAVRSYISERIGDKYLIPLLGVYDNVKEINWNDLPDKFVLKCTHASGANIICKNKSELDIADTELKLKKWLKKNWYWFGREWPYKNVKPKIICEPFISETNNTPDDYKVLCFNGEAKLIEVHNDIYGAHKQNFYDVKWNKTNISRSYANSSLVHEKPKQLREMLELSELLSTNIVHARIDWFIVNDKLYFGEITFFDHSGLDFFDNEEDDYLLGSWISINN